MPQSEEKCSYRLLFAITQDVSEGRGHLLVSRACSLVQGGSSQLTQQQLRAIILLVAIVRLAECHSPDRRESTLTQSLCSTPLSLTNIWNRSDMVDSM
jgi:hypothetical protein